MFNYMLKYIVILGVLNLCAQAKSFNAEIVDYAEYENEMQDNVESVDIEPRQFIISWHARRAVRKILKQMECGWEDFNIPPLAPYENENLTFNLLSNFTNSHTAFQPIRIDGLNNMDINKLTVSVIPFFKHVNFDFNFPKINTTGKFNFSTIIDHSEIGFTFNLDAFGQLNFILENLRLRGSFKFNVPIFTGSVKIYDFKTMLTIGDVCAQLNGTLNGKPITNTINSAIEQNFLSVVNDNQIFISALMEQLLVPRVNEQLKGKKLWDIIKWSLNSDESECIIDGSVENEGNRFKDNKQNFEF